VIRIEPEVARVARALGIVRDADLLKKFLAERWQKKDSIPARRELLERVEVDRVASLRKARAQLKPETFDSWGKMLRGSERPPHALASVPIEVVEPDIVEIAFRRMKKAARRAATSKCAEDVHRLRRRAKHFRYVLDAAAVLYRKAVVEFVKELQIVQDLLGTRQDLYQASSRLNEFSRDPALTDNARAEALRLATEAEDQANRFTTKALTRTKALEGQLWRRLKEHMARNRRCLVSSRESNREPN
jgi:CHAD domain-containing protein